MSRTGTHEFCSGVCLHLDNLLNSVEKTCNRIEPAKASELWAEMVAALDAVTEATRTLDRVRLEAR